jgi:3-oxoadipate enol-lactonase
MAVFQTSGINISYEDKNPDGEHCVAFFNGVMASYASWYLLYPFFEKMGWRVILHDLRGQLMSDKPEGPYTFKQHADDAKALFDHLGVKKAHLVGTSYGGETAMKFAMEYPEMAASLSLIGVTSELDEVLKGFVDNWLSLVSTGDGETMFWGLAHTLYGHKFLNENREMLSQRAVAIKNNPNGYLDGLKILFETFANDVFMTDQLHRIKCPSLVIWVEEDILQPRKFSDIIAREIPNSEYMIIPGSGHVTIFEKHQELASAIIGFALKTALTTQG